MARVHRRRLAAVLLALAIVPGVVLKDQHRAPDRASRLTITALAIPSVPADELGPLRHPAAWQLSSDNALFGGYSALLPGRRGLVALSDKGIWLALPRLAAGQGWRGAATQGHMIRDPARVTEVGDAEAVAQDPAGTVWVAWEDQRSISRFGPGWTDEHRARPAALQGWDRQFGAESMLRLPGGQFVLTSEAFTPRTYQRSHLTLVYPGDPTDPAAVPARGVLRAPAGYRPTDMALLPDGRALVLLRELAWPLPLRFSCLLALADPDELLRTGRWTARPVAPIAAPLPTDNYEGLALTPRGDGLLDLWIISDDNRASTQRTLLLRFTLDPRRLAPRT